MVTHLEPLSSHPQHSLVFPGRNANFPPHTVKQGSPPEQTAVLATSWVDTHGGHSLLRRKTDLRRGTSSPAGKLGIWAGNSGTQKWEGIPWDRKSNMAQPSKAQSLTPRPLLCSTPAAVVAVAGAQLREHTLLREAQLGTRGRSF